MRRFWTALMCLVFVGALLCVAGCSGTWHGMGRDVENAGETMQGR